MKTWIPAVIIAVCFPAWSLLAVLLPTACLHAQAAQGLKSSPVQGVRWTSQGGSYEIGAHSYEADYGTLVVPENRERTNSRRIELPLIRLHATGGESSVPVFFLAGGPGGKNVYTAEDLGGFGLDDMPYHWLLQDHDFVMVGYRGVDGASGLATPRSDEAAKVDSRPLSAENLRKVAEAMQADYSSLKSGGIDVDAYNAVQVVGDMESARVALGYERVDLYSQSYGTRVAYIYGLLYPDSILRSVMISANFPGGFVWEPTIVEAQLQQYAELWKRDPASRERSPDILQTMSRVLSSLEDGGKWLIFDIDVDKVKVMTFASLFTVEGAAQVFDAYVAAEQGDYSGMAYLSVAYDMNQPHGLGDKYCKAVSLDHDPDRNYVEEMDPPGAVLGSPLGKLLWGPTDFGAWPMKAVAEPLRRAHTSDVETLIVNGNLDFSTPLSQAEKYLEYLPNAQLVVVSDAGHVHDVEEVQAEAFQKLVTGYLESGLAESTFVERPMNFTPPLAFTTMAKQYVVKPVLAGLAVLAALAGVIVWLRRRRRRASADGVGR